MSHEAEAAADLVVRVRTTLASGELTLCPHVGDSRRAPTLCVDHLGELRCPACTEAHAADHPRRSRSTGRCVRCGRRRVVLARLAGPLPLPAGWFAAVTRDRRVLVSCPTVVVFSGLGICGRCHEEEADDDRG